MSRRLSILFGIFSLLAVSLLLILLYKFANSSEPVYYNSFTQENSSLKESVKNSINNSWLEGLAQRKRPLDSYPVTEIELIFGVADKAKSRVSYRMVISDLDAYELFCIREILERLNLEYMLYKDSVNSKIVVWNLKKRVQKDIIDKISEYNVKIEFEKYIKD